MGLLDIVKAAVGVAMNATDEFKKTLTYTSKPSASYDTSTGTVTNPNQISTSVEVIITQAKSHEINGVSVLANDQWALINPDDITVVPKESDEATFENKNYRIVAVRKIIASGAVLWKVQLRTRK